MLSGVDGVVAVAEVDLAVPELGPKEVARAMGVSRDVAFALMKSGRIKCIDLGVGTRKYLRTKPEWVKAFLAQESAK